jgi:parvulin-like peptidyl-prolyl isomerase
MPPDPAARTSYFLALTFVALSGLLSSAAWGQAAPGASKSRAPVARVNQESIVQAEVDAELRRAVGDQPIAELRRSALARAALDQIIDRRLVLGYLHKTGQAASEADIDLALAQFETELKSQELTLAQHCDQVGLSIDDLRRSLGWKLSWQRYLERQLVAVNLEKYFNKYRREFDGTRLHVAQILFQLSADADEAMLDAAKHRAEQLRQEITAGKLSFPAAAQQHSQAPSAASGGDIGWIERHQPMPEEFSRAAFALQPGEISQPLVSSFGVHLIMVLDEKPGGKAWRDATAELRPAVTLYLFRWIADQERTGAKIDYAP